MFLIEPEQAESNVQKAPSRRRTASTLEELCARADRYSNGEGFRTILKAAERAAEKHPLYLRTTKNSVMVTPRANRTRTLFTFWPRYGTRDQLTIAVAFENWPEYFDVEEETVASILGPDNFRIGITYQDVEEFSANVDRLFEKIEQKTG